MPGGRPKGSKDSRKRTRPCMTEQHKQARRVDNNRRTNGNSLMTNFIVRNNATEDTQGDTNHEISQADHVVATFSDNHAASNINAPIEPRAVDANLDVDEEGEDDDPTK